MASTLGRSSRDLIDEITQDASRFSFFQAVRILALSNENKKAQPVPHVLRFGTPLSLAFPASEILSAERRCSDEIAVDDPLALILTVAFMGLTGPFGVLPQPYTELLIERRNNYRDTTAHQFLDLFSHRLISLFYEAWRKRRVYLDHEAGNQDRFDRNMLDLVGIGSKSLQAKLQTEKGGVPDRFLAQYAGLLSQKPVSAANLIGVLKGYFRVGVQLNQFVGHWIAVPDMEQTRMGRQSCVLGENMFIGARLWDRQTKIGITLGPLSAAQFADFLPGEPGHSALLELVRFCLGHSLACDVTLVLQGGAVRPLRLSCALGQSCRLGFDTWLCNAPSKRDRDDTHYHLLV